MDLSGRRTLKTMLFGIGLITAMASPTLAQKGLDEPFQDSFKQSLAGKTVAYVPVAMNFDLTEGWFAGVKKELEPYGVKVIVRDPNWSTNAGAQAVTTLISEKPAAMIIHNPDVQTYAKLLQRAENEGIYARERGHLCHPDQYGLELSQFGLRRRQLDRDRRTRHRGGGQRLQGQIEQDRHRPGRIVGRGERLHAQGR